jgi:hypothetical protein
MGPYLRCRRAGSPRRGFWSQHLDELATELARGRRTAAQARAPPDDGPDFRKGPNVIEIGTELDAVHRRVSAGP